MTDRYAVFGNPVAHSKSPMIHAEFARQTGEDIVYERQLVDTEYGKFHDAVHKFFDGGGCGLNITVPFKLDAFAFADQLTERAKCAGAQVCCATSQKISAGTSQASVCWYWVLVARCAV